MLPTPWSRGGPLDPWRLALRLQRARVVQRTYAFRKIAETRHWLAFRVTGGQAPYLVRLDLTGSGAHYCSCPDGDYRVQADSVAGSLCKHVLGGLFREGREGQLLPLLCGLSAPAFRRHP
ncbi:MAG: SWIM zinc finger family protein [Elusimicrobia bacterium]|nr:SWIM zinc finger family protein [Elusimicrobiota bacterium]